MYDVHLYSLTHRGNPGDLSFYLSACKGAKDVLELGCGFGRILLPLAQAGHSVIGLDNHPGMLDAIREQLEENQDLQKADIQLVEGDFRYFEIDRQFDRIILPFNTLYGLLSEEDLLAALRQIKKHLKPSGSFIFDVHMVDEEELAFIIDGEWDLIAQLIEDEDEIQILEKRLWDKEKQRVDAHYRYVITDEECNFTTKNYTIPQRYLHPEQCEKFLNEVGLYITQLYGDFSYSSFSSRTSPHMIVWAKTITPPNI